MIILGGVDAALRGDGVRAARGILEAEALDVVAELAERGGGAAAGQAGAHHDDVVLALVGRIHQLQVEAVICPSASRSGRREFWSRVPCALLSIALQHAQRHHDRDGNIADGDEPGEGRREFLEHGRVTRMAHAQRLEHAPDAVVEVHAEQDHGEDVEAGDGGVLESGDDVGAHVHVAVG